MAGSVIVTDQSLEQYQRAVQQEVRRKANEQLSAELNGQQPIVRDLLPADDLDSGSDNGWNGTDRYWVQDFSGASGSAPGKFESYVINHSNGSAQNKVIALFMLKDLTANPQTTEITFQAGRNGNNGVIDQIEVEGASTEDDKRAVELESIIFGTTDNATINQYVKDKSNAQNVYFGGYVAETPGTTLTRTGNIGSGV